MDNTIINAVYSLPLLASNMMWVGIPTGIRHTDCAQIWPADL